MDTKQLWSDEQIDTAVRNWYNTAITSKDVIGLLYHIRNEYEARIAELEAASGMPQPDWTPVPRSLEYDLITYAIKHGELSTEYRICQRPIAPSEVTK